MNERKGLGAEDFAECENQFRFIIGIDDGSIDELLKSRAELTCAVGELWLGGQLMHGADRETV